MKKIFFCFMLGVLLFTAQVVGKNVAIITEIMKPTSISIDDYLYINETTTIYIYNKKDYSYITKFGKEGEGPQEFRAFAAIIPQKDNLLINSLGKISYYTKDGQFIKEIKAKGGGGNNLFWPVKDGYVGRTNTVEDKVNYHTINLYDKQLQKVKEIYRFENYVQLQAKGKIFWPPRQPTYQTHNNQVIIAGKPGFIINILADNGDSLFTIENKDYQKRKFSQEDRKSHEEYLKMKYKQQYEAAKQYLTYSDYYPEIANVFVDNNKIYALTWKFDEGKFEIFEYDMEGNLLQRFLATIAMQNILEPFPMGIKNGKIYQLIENDDEEWELHITNLKK